MPDLRISALPVLAAVDIATGDELPFFDASAAETKRVTVASLDSRWIQVTSLDADIATLVLPASTTISAFGATLIDDATNTAARTTLGLGNAATMTVDADLATLVLPASTTISAAGAALIDDATATAQIATLGLDADIATLVLPASTTISAFGATLVDDANAATARTTLGIILRGEKEFTVPGTLVVGAGILRVYFTRTVTVTNVWASVATAPTGATAIFDVNRNGTTIFTTQANRPTIAISGFSDLTSSPDVTSFVSGDYLTVDVDQIGSTIAGANAVVGIEFTEII